MRAARGMTVLELMIVLAIIASLTILGRIGLRALTGAELDNRAGLSRRISEQTKDFYAGLRYSLSMLLQLPDFIFRSESAIPSAGGNLATAFMTNDVAADFVSINADGTRQDKAQMISDSARAKMVGAATFKLFDKNIRTYGNVGIITGRARAYLSGKYIVEFLYTAVFVKQNDKWMYASWQGTISKDSPVPPPMPQGN